MLEKDEFDEYNDSLDVENDLYIYAASTSFSAPDAPPDSNPSSQGTGGVHSQGDAILSPLSTHSEFSDFDLSEFTAADFAAIDASALAALASTLGPTEPESPPIDEVDVEYAGTSAPTRHPTRLDAPPVDSAGGTGGPAIEIAIDSSADTSAQFRPATREEEPEVIPSEAGPSGSGAGHGDGDGNGHRRSPYQEFRLWRGRLAVTDLTGPSW